MQSKVEATVDIASVTTGDDTRDAHLKSADFFDAEQYPTMTLVSTGIDQDGSDYVLHADLTIKGVTKPVDFELEFDGVSGDPVGRHPRRVQRRGRGQPQGLGPRVERRARDRRRARRREGQDPARHRSRQGLTRIDAREERQMIRRLNHAVLWVRDAQASAEFYTTVLGFEAVATMGNQAVFLRADGSTNDHDLGSVQCREIARSRRPIHPACTTSPGRSTPSRSSPHCAPSCVAAGSLVGESDHGVSKSLYAADPDGIEFEVMWAVPKENWPSGPTTRGSTSMPSWPAGRRSTPPISSRR